MNSIRLFFAWPQGGVWANLIASLLWATPAFIYTHRKLRKMHKHIKRVHDHLGIKEDV